MAKTTKPRDIDKSWDNPLNLLRDLRLAWRLLLDRRVPFVTKLIPIVALLYIISPIDLMPDLLVGLGQLDDLAILLLGLKAFVNFSPAVIVAQHAGRLDHRQDTTGKMNDEPDYVNAEYRVMRDDE